MLLDDLIEGTNVLKAIIVTLDSSFWSSLSVYAYIFSSNSESSIITSGLNCLSVLVGILIFVRFYEFKATWYILFVIVFFFLVMGWLFKLHILDIHLLVWL